MKMENLEETIARDRRYLFTIIAVISTLGILANSIRSMSPIIGTGFTAIYFLINSVFLGNLFFKEEDTGFRVLFGLLILLMIIALEGASLITASAIIPIRFDAKATVALLNLATAITWLLRRARFARLFGLNTT